MASKATNWAKNSGWKANWKVATAAYSKVDLMMVVNLMADLTMEVNLMVTKGAELMNWVIYMRSQPSKS